MSAGWTPVSKAQRRKFVTRMTGDQMLYQTPLYSAPGGGASERTPGYEVKAVRQQNVSGSTAVVGLAAVVPNRNWVAGQYVDATTTFTDDTTDAQDVGTSDFALTTNTNNDGFVVGSRCPIGLIGIDVGRAATSSGTPVYAVLYTQDNGSGVPQLGTLAAGTLLVAPDFSATGEQIILFNPPNDFIPSVVGTITGFPAGYYAVLVEATTAPTSNTALATLLTVGRPFAVTRNVANNTVVESFTSQEFDPEGSGDRRFSSQLAAVFSVASDGNLTELLVRPKG